jgi:diguanylate cyclase (GGDEF)-like protein
MKSIVKADDKTLGAAPPMSTGLTGALNRLWIRVLGCFVVALPVSFVIANAANPLLVPMFSAGLAQEIASEMGMQTAGSFETLKIISSHDLAWCYVTNGSGTVLPRTRPFAPNLQEYEEKSREVVVNNARYYETVQRMNGTEVLHIGVPYEQRWESFNSSAFVSNLLTPVRFGIVMSTLALVFLILLAIIELIVSRPLSTFTKAIVGASASSNKAKHLKAPLGAPTEITQLAVAIKDFAILNDVSKLNTKSRSDEKDSERARRAEIRTAQTPSGPVPAVPASGKSSPLMRSFEYELSSAQSTKMFAEQALGGLHERYPDVITLSAFFKLDRDYQPTILASMGLDEESLQLLREIDHREIARGSFANAKSADIGPMLIRRLGIEELASINDIRRILYLPVKHRDSDLAAIVVFLQDEEAINADQLRSIERFRDQISNFFHKLLILEEAEEADWTDQLTGLRNRQFFQELMGHVIERAVRTDNKSFSLLMISGDFLDVSLQHLGSDVRDRWMQELARILRNNIDIKDRLEQSVDPANYVIRYQGDEFAAVLEDCTMKQALELALQIRASVESTEQWAGGVKGLTVSIGCSTYPEDGTTVDDMVAKARNALLYLNEQMGPNQICHIQKVPKGFKPSRRGSAFSGELGVLDCAGLLQSIATSQKTGLLSVQDDTGRQLLVSWEKGRPRQAKLDNIVGVPAIIEFVVTFETGTFTFQQRQNYSIDNAGEDIGESLERILMEGALSEDHVRAAKRLIPNMELLVRAVPGIENAYRWLRLQEDREVTRDELACMRTLIKLADGNKSLTKIFLDMKDSPSYIVWRAAGVLVENRLLQVKKV